MVESDPSGPSTPRRCSLRLKQWSGALLLSGGLGCTSVGSLSTPPPDVIFITIDTLRMDHVGSFDAASPAQTPNMDRLAEMGVRYTQAYSPISVTGPAFVTLHTGQDPDRHGVRKNIFRGGNQVPEDAETLAKRLKSEGYDTGAFLSGFTLRPELGLSPGFDAYRFPERSENKKNNRRDGAKTAKMATTWLEKQDGPVFLWFHTYDVHGPLNRWSEVPTTAEWDQSIKNLQHIPAYQRIGQISDPDFYAQRYAKAVEYTDLQVGKILDTLESTGRLERALIVLTADHGETFDERELWFDHGTHATEEQLHVPLVIHFPQGSRSGEVAEELVGLMDVAPTVLNVLEMEPLAAADGRSLRLSGSGHTILMGESSHCKSTQEPVLTCAPSGVHGKEISARTNGQTVIDSMEAQGAIRQVYDRQTDPNERSPLVDPVVTDGVNL